MELRLLRYFVVVADERHVGRAAARLRMTQPPLSRAIRQLEDDLGVELFERTARGVEVTAAGAALHREAHDLLRRVEGLPARVAAAAGTPSIAVGTCADTAEQIGSQLVTEFRRRHPHVDLILHETDLTDPTAGLRGNLVDVALTRAPFDESGIATRVLRSDPMGVVVPETDPLSDRASVSLSDVRDRRWIRLPDGVDEIWRAYWLADRAASGTDTPPVVRTIQESLQSVLWSNATTMAPSSQALPDGLVSVPLADKTPSRVVVAWKDGGSTPFVSAFVELAVELIPYV